MFRYIIGIVVSLVALSFVRAVWTMIQKALVDELQPSTPNQPSQSQSRPQPSASTTLRKCATCGTYKPESAMTKFTSGNETIYICCKKA